MKRQLLLTAPLLIGPQRSGQVLWRRVEGRVGDTEAKHQPQSRGKSQGKMWATPLIVVSVGRNGGAGLHLSSLNILSELWSVGAVPSCLVPALRRQ